jgi:hypothetical protein
MAIDWKWVKKELIEKERIGLIADDRRKREVTGHLRRCLADAKRLARPRTALKKYVSAGFSAGSVTLEGGVSFRGRRAAGYLKNATGLYLYCVTIGGRLESEASRRMKKGDALGGYLLDRAGSFAVESLASGAEKALRARYRLRGLSVSMRISPGYCDMPIEAQRALSRAVPFSAAGVKLNRSMMMVPRKSISGIIGVGPKGAFGGAVSQCRVCDRGNCTYRR